jgi:adhesin/invasin
MKNIIYIFIALFMVLTISSCGENGSATNGSTPTQTNTPPTVSLVADKTQAVADGSDGVTLTVTVKDSLGTPIVQKGVSLNIPTNYYSYLSPELTDNNGQVVIFVSQLVTRNFFHQIVSPTETTYLDVIASVDGVSSNTLNITYMPMANVITASVSLVADKALAIADGIDTITITATVKDVNGSIMPYRYINFTVSPGASRFMSPGYTDANGLAVIHLTSPPSTLNDKVINVTATSSGVTSNTVSATFSNPPQVTPALVTLAADKTTFIADGPDKIVFTLTATDSIGNPLAGQLYHLNLPQGPYLSATNIMTNTAGVGTCTLMRYSNPPLTSSTNISITGTINGTTSNAIVITVNPP